MPCYLLETDVVVDSQIEAAVRLASQRFPELAVENISIVRYRARAFWVCRAPSEAHVDRWARAAHLASHGCSLTRRLTAR